MTIGRRQSLVGAGACLLAGIGVSVPGPPAAASPHTSSLAWRLAIQPDAIGRVATHRRMAFLTFDDGPDPDYTPTVLEILARFEVPATFFMIGRNLQAYPELVYAVAARGHRIANHTPEPSVARRGGLPDTGSPRGDRRAAPGPPRTQPRRCACRTQGCSGRLAAGPMRPWDVRPPPSVRAHRLLDLSRRQPAALTARAAGTARLPDLSTGDRCCCSTSAPTAHSSIGRNALTHLRPGSDEICSGVDSRGHVIG